MSLLASPIQIAEQIASDLETRGLAVVDHFISAELVARLALESDELLAGGRMRPARIGKGDQRRLDPRVRGDLIAWFQPAELSAAQAAYMEQIEETRLALNRRLFLGLFDFEACQARYPEGARYRRHRDRFSRAGRRIMTLVTYLNESWQAGDGGELLVHLPDGEQRLIEPLAGRAVAFFSDRFPHEVLEARRPRKSIAGWYRGRP